MEKLFIIKMKTNKIIAPKIWKCLALIVSMVFIMQNNLKSEENHFPLTNPKQSVGDGLLVVKKITCTAYCNNNNGKPCIICNGKWAKYNKTADGHVPKAGITCAAPRNIPFGTILEIEGVGRRVVQDRTALRFGDRVDIFFPSHKEALKFGKKQLRVTVIK